MAPSTPCIRASVHKCVGIGLLSRSGGELRSSDAINMSGSTAAALSHRDLTSPARPMIRARPPAAQTPGGIADETTLPARISAPSPMVTPLAIVTRLPILQPSPIVSLNRAVAVAMVEGPRPALALIDELAATGDLDSYHLLHASRADLLRRLGFSAEAAASYRRAVTMVGNESERRFLERRLREMQALDA